jgi:3-methyladenine DNA glycosylase/8-oxoguanine DNA glycosylase
VLRVLASHAVPGAEIVDLDAGSYRRLLPGPNGPTAITISFLRDAATVEIDADPGTAEALRPAVVHLLDAEADPAKIAAILGTDGRLGPLVAARPGLRVVGHPNGWEAAVTTVLGQQVSLAAARTFAGRLSARYGTPHSSGLRWFPTPQTIAAADPEELRAAVGITRTRGRTVQRTAEAFAAGLVLAPEVDHADARRSLLGIPGIGPWTIEYLAVRVLGDRDAFPSGDLVLRRALGDVGAKEAEALSQAWRPLRAYALLHLWTSAVPALA